LRFAAIEFTKAHHGQPYPFIDPLKLDMTGRAVFVTGASKGIGRTTAAAFAKAGAS